MKRFVKNLVLLFLSFAVSMMVVSAYAQKKKDKTDTYKPSNYEYEIGEKLILSLLDGCSVLNGTIKAIKGNQVDFVIKERLLVNEPVTDTIVLNYKKPVSRIAISSEGYSPWNYVDVQEGKELYISYCKGKTGLRENGFIISDGNLFADIKKSVSHYIAYKQNPKTLLDAPRLVNSYNSKIFVGYIVSFLWRSGATVNSEDAVLVLIQLLENDKIPASEFGLIYSTLQRLITGEGYLKPETRNKIVDNLISLGISNKKAAERAVNILIRLANDNSVDLKPFFNKKNRQKLLQNYKTFTLKNISQKEREKFEKLLMDK